ncbi:transketolase, partial [Staphylococcus aureus]|nr:transketolase [Staphylococcus aureus]
LEKQCKSVRVVSMPNWNAFEQQSEEYKESVIPSSVTKRVAIEMASPLGWHKYVGTAGKVIAIDGFGASAPGDLVVEKYGFTKENILNQVMSL